MSAVRPYPIRVEGTLDPGSSFNLIGSFASNSSDSGGISPSSYRSFSGAS